MEAGEDTAAEIKDHEAAVAQLRRWLVICKIDCPVNQPLWETSAEINTASKEMNSLRVKRERAILQCGQRLFRHDCKIAHKSDE